MVESETVRSLLDTVERRVGHLERASDVPLEEYLDDLREFVEALVPELEERGGLG